MSENEYDLRKSTEKIGELYPVIVSKSGEIVDGFHRINAKANWRREVREDIDTPEKVLKARLISNKFRRQVTAEEVRGWINDLAEIAYTEHGIEPGEISGWVAEETGYQAKTVMGYLNEKYKNPIFVEGGKMTPQSDGGVSFEQAKSVAEPLIHEAEPEVDLETPNGLKKAAKALEREAKRKVKAQKTPEQLEAEKAEKLRKKQEREAKKKEAQAKKEKKLAEKIRQEITTEKRQELKEELVKDPDFIKEVKRTIIAAPIPAPREETEPVRVYEPPPQEKILLTCYITSELNEALEEHYLKTETMKDEAIETLLWRGLKSQ